MLPSEPISHIHGTYWPQLRNSYKQYRSYLQTVVQLRPATINRQLISVKRYFAWALATQQITRDPSRAVKAIPQEVVPPHHLTDQEEHALIAAVEQHGTERDRVIVLLLLHAGLRAEEVCGLRRDQVTLGRRSGHLAIYGKWNKYREVPLNSTTRQALEPYLAHLQIKGGWRTSWSACRAQMACCTRIGPTR